MDISYYRQYEPIFGSWYITRLIGEGSFGQVFEIERTDFGKTYKAALKAITIPQNESEIKSMFYQGLDDDGVTTFFRGVAENVINEFDIMSRMKGNSNIVSYEDHITIERKDKIGWDILIRMELLTPVEDYFSDKAVDESDIIKLGIDLCRAVETCKKQNVIHRDIKPENIFISANGDFKLGDFGVAKTIEKSIGLLSSKKGTIAYMAPEVYKGAKYDYSVDLYSIGIVLYRYMNNKRVPFMPQPPELITYTKKEEAIDRRMSGEHLPAPINASESFCQIILKACSYNSEDRYDSAEEMRTALECLAGKGHTVPTVSPNYNLDSYEKTNDDSSNTPKNPDEPKPPKPQKWILFVVSLLIVVALIIGAIVLIPSGETSDGTSPKTEISSENTSVADKVADFLLEDYDFNSFYLNKFSEDEQLYYTFLDLDFDGVNELIVNYSNKQDHSSYNEYYKINLKEKKLEFLPCGNLDSFDINNSNIYLFKHKTGSGYPFYITKSTIAYSYETGDSIWVRFHKIGYDFDVYSHEILNIDLFRDNGEEKYLCWDTVLGKDDTVSEGEIEKYLSKKEKGLINKYNDDYINLELSFKTIDAAEYNSMSAFDKKAALCEAYLAFGYEDESDNKGFSDETTESQSEISTTEAKPEIMLSMGINDFLKFIPDSDNIYIFNAPEDNYYLFESISYDYGISVSLIANDDSLDFSDTNEGGDKKFQIVRYCYADTPIYVHVSSTDTKSNITPPDSLTINIDTIGKSNASLISKWKDFEKNGLYLEEDDTICWYEGNEANFVNFTQAGLRYPVTYDISDGHLLLGFIITVDGKDNEIIGWYKVDSE